MREPFPERRRSIAKKTTTAGNLRITKGTKLVLIASAAIVAGATSPAAAANVVHLRAIVLGTTPEGLDVGLPSGDDVHLDMPREPYVSIAEPATTQALRIGAHVSIVSSSAAPNAHLVGIVVFGTDVRFVHDGSYAWDEPQGARMTTGRIVHSDRANARLSIVVAYTSAKRRVAVPQNTPVITLRPGSRAALLNPHAIFVFATPPTDGLSLVMQSAIVGDGALQLPL